MTGTQNKQSDPLFEGMDFDQKRLGNRKEQLRNIRENLLKTVRRAARHVPFVDEVLAGYFCTRDPQTPIKVKLTLTAALAYFVLPMDAIPDFLLGVGFGDDTAVLLAALSMVRGHIQPKHWQAAKDALEKGSLPEEDPSDEMDATADQPSGFHA